MKALLPLALPLLLVPTLAHAADGDAPAVCQAGPDSLLVRTPPAVSWRDLGPGPEHRVLYLNRHGGTYSRVFDPAQDNSATNETYVLSIGDASGTIPPLDMPEQTWEQVRACVERVYAPFAITITEEEPPASTVYMEAVVGGTGFDLGLQGADGIGGISAGSLFDCSVNERCISFTFDYWGSDVETWCAVIAQESGHCFGLDHSLNCLDPMTYQPFCGPYGFQDSDDVCGEDPAMPRPCYCTNSTQNTHDLLTDMLGPADHVPPTVAFHDLAENASVTADLELRIDATDDVRVDRVIVSLDGAVLGTLDTPAYQTRLPADLAIGEHTLEAVAVDGGDNRTTTTVKIAAVPQCTAPADCGGDGFICEGGKCQGEIGTPCDLHGQCASGVCFADPDANRFCSVECADSSVCPSGFSCQAPMFGSDKCLPTPPDTGWCATSPRRRTGAPLAAVLLFAALVALRPRCRRT